MHTCVQMMWDGVKFAIRTPRSSGSWHHHPTSYEITLCTLYARGDINNHDRIT